MERTRFSEEILQSLLKDVGCRTAQQKEFFTKGASAVADFIAEAGIKETVLPKIRSEINFLNDCRRSAEMVLESLRSEVAANVAPVELTDKERHIVTLTGSLLDVYKEKMGNAAASDIVRAVSYSVWAHLNPGATPDKDAIAKPEK